MLRLCVRITSWLIDEYKHPKVDLADANIYFRYRDILLTRTLIVEDIDMAD